MGRGENEHLDSAIGMRTNPITGFSEAADSHPDRNEDAVFISEDGRFAAVFDGIGGGGGGDRISVAAVRALSEIDPLPSDAETYDQAEWLREAVADAQAAAHREVHSTIQGATAVFAQRVSRTELLIRSAGDSRAYAFSAGSGLRRLTIDGDNHPLRDPADEWLSMRLDQAADESDLDEDELRAFRSRNIVTSDLVSTDPGAWPFQVELDPLESVILTTDGVHDNLTSDEIEATLLEEISAERLVAAARARAREHSFRSKDDDITCAVIR